MYWCFVLTVDWQYIFQKNLGHQKENLIFEVKLIGLRRWFHENFGKNRDCPFKTKVEW